MAHSNHSILQYCDPRRPEFCRFSWFPGRELYPSWLKPPDDSCVPSGPRTARGWYQSLAPCCLEVLHLMERPKMDCCSAGLQQGSTFELLLWIKSQTFYAWGDEHITTDLVITSHLASTLIQISDRLMPMDLSHNQLESELQSVRALLPHHPIVYQKFSFQWLRFWEKK